MPVEAIQPATPAVVMRDVHKSFPEAFRLAHLRKPFARERVPVLSGLNWRVARGSITGLLGVNGSGKSTLLRLISGLLTADSGHLRVFDMDPASERLRTSGKVGVILPNERGFFWRISVRRNLEFFAIMNNFSREQAAHEAEQAARRLGLSASMDRPFRDLSDGMKQRMAVARGMLGDPPLLLVDEATRSLDPGGAERVRDLLRRKTADGEAAIILVSHNLDEVESLCDRLCLLKEGAIVIDGPTGEVKQRVREVLMAAETEAL